MRKLLCAYLLGMCIHPLYAADPGEDPQVIAPGYGDLQFEAPRPGTYRLDVLGKAADGDVIDSDGTATRLHHVMGDKISLLSFIYATCSDVNGCPLATSVFYRIKRSLEESPELSDELRLITLSFDPAHDTPDVMKKYGQGFQDAAVEWRFLTTRSEQSLRPILEDYRQVVRKDYDEQGRFLGTYSHLLRVYLIDSRKRLRNIYSVAFLHPDTLINDVKTLLQERVFPIREVASAFKQGPGDDKKGYEQIDYKTRSIALGDRVGETADLIENALRPPLGLPAVPVPEGNPISAEKIALGRKLFYDRRLSFNNTFSCAMCHIPEQGFTSNEMAMAVGIEGRTVRRNAPSLFNVAYSKTLFHDGRETTLEQQIWGPLLASNEMANPSFGYVIDRLKNNPDYTGLFEQAFGRGPGMETIGMAIASYERTLNSGNSPFDRWYYGKEQQAISKEAKRGFALFTGEARCAACHVVDPEHAVFTDDEFHNTGIGFEAAMGNTDKKQRLQVAPGVYIDVEAATIDSVSEPSPSDLGRYEVTQVPEDRWKYKTPSLRNVALTAPYMHNGVFKTLREVVAFYNNGGVANENLDPLIKPLRLTDEQVNDLVTFLYVLTGDNVDKLVSDAFAAPIGDPR